MMQNILMMHYHMHQNYITGHHGQGHGRGRGCGRDGCGRGWGRTQGDGGSYCHTHGNCNHLGENCNTPRENHNPAATFNNILGGSSGRCFWITPEWQDGSDIVNNLNQCYLTSSDNHTNKYTYEVIPDTAATKHYIIPQDLNICDKVEDTLGPKLAVADGHIILPTKKAILPLSNKLTEKYRVVLSFDNLKSGSLISIGQLCDENCIAILSNYDFQIIQHNEILVKVKRTDNWFWEFHYLTINLH